MPDSGLLAGLAGGITSTAALHPIDLIKVRLQVQHVAFGDAGSGSHHQRYKGIVHAARLILKEEGLRGFYKGVVPGMAGSGLSWGLYFFFYERLKAKARVWAASSADGDAAKLGPAAHMACAMASGCATVMFTNPVWLVKTRLQLQLAAHSPGSPAPYSGMVDAFRSIVRQEGWTGLYRGVGPALLLTSHGAVQFAVYEELRRIEVPAGLAPLWHFAIGAASKVLATTVTYPYQVIKSRIQVRGSKFRGVIDCAMDAFRREGPIGFYRGYSANLLRVVPASAITLTAYEAFRPMFATMLGEAHRA
ncbi:hypothetical protein FNF29_02752 [Cafeteria roenbergensis]|uniref:Mitochondrial folate transporter/carrier n=1 Tax=Cafeteria roenbergensis TaxID=33653 RepID=A0A5A8CM37_CAFRO|nr:hypothetical protein FNF29_02752 [Cafeteria roenbergensis]|eukprot:KAA0154132.1 hypothetical protein FNF29_02752 [Cafeteria roenbergensis]